MQRVWELTQPVTQEITARERGQQEAELGGKKKLFMLKNCKWGKFWVVIEIRLHPASSPVPAEVSEVWTRAALRPDYVFCDFNLLFFVPKHSHTISCLKLCLFLLKESLLLFGKKTQKAKIENLDQV